MDIKTTPKTNDLVKTFISVKRGTTTEGNYDFNLVVRTLKETIEDLEFYSFMRHIREVLGEAGTRQSTSKDLNRHGEDDFYSVMHHIREVLGLPEKQAQDKRQGTLDLEYPNKHKDNFDLLVEYLRNRAEKIGDH